jgi:hypothetical protein
VHLRFSRLRWPEWVMGAGGLVVLGSMPLPWFTRTPRPGRWGRKHVTAESIDGWHGLGRERWLVLATGVAGLKVVFLQARQRAPALPVAATFTTAPLAAGTAVWLIVRMWIAPPAKPEIGGSIGLLGAAVIAYGGYRSIRMEGIAPADAPADIPTVDLAREGAT